MDKLKANISHAEKYDPDYVQVMVCQKCGGAIISDGTCDCGLWKMTWQAGRDELEHSMKKPMDLAWMEAYG